MKLSRASVGLAIRTAREAAGFTLNDLAKLTEITVTSLSRSENGLRDIDFSEAVAIASAVKMDVENLRTLAETFEHAGVAESTRKRSDLAKDLSELQRLAIEAALEALHE